MIATGMTKFNNTEVNQNEFSKIDQHQTGVSLLFYVYVFLYFLFLSYSLFLLWPAKRTHHHRSKYDAAGEDRMAEYVETLFRYTEPSWVSDIKASLENLNRRFDEMEDTITERVCEMIEEQFDFEVRPRYRGYQASPPHPGLMDIASPPTLAAKKCAVCCLISQILM